MPAREKAGTRASPGAEAQQKGGSGDPEATKRQHKQEAGPRMRGWGPESAGKSPGEVVRAAAPPLMLREQERGWCGGRLSAQGSE